MMYDSFEVDKVLVIAPLRVADMTWPDEVEKWGTLKEFKDIKDYRHSQTTDGCNRKKSRHLHHQQRKHQVAYRLLPGKNKKSGRLTP